MVDVTAYVWDHEREHWRLLTLSEQRVLWEAARGVRNCQGMVEKRATVSRFSAMPRVRSKRPAQRLVIARVARDG